MVFYWSLSDSNSPRVSRTILSILVVLNNGDVWMVSTRPPTSKSSSPFSNPLVTVPKAPITYGIIVTFMFHNCFFKFSSKVEVFILLFLFFQFYSVFSRNSKVDNFQIIIIIIINCFIIIIIIIIIIGSFSHHRLLVFFHSSLSYSKSPQVSGTLLSIMGDIKNVVFWIVTTCPVISRSFSPLTNSLVTVLRASITIGITIALIFHIFFKVNLQGRGTYSFFCLFLSVLLIYELGQENSQFYKFFFFVD